MKKKDKKEWFTMTEQDKELKHEYEEFIKTDEGKQWKKKWQKRFDSDDDIVGDFTDYLCDFHPKALR